MHEEEWRKRREIKLLGGGFSGAHESAFAREQYLVAQTLCFVSYYSRHSQYSFSLPVINAEVIRQR